MRARALSVTAFILPHRRQPRASSAALSPPRSALYMIAKKIKAVKGKNQYQVCPHK